MASLELGDPLAHRALQALLRAEATVRRRLALELEREGVTAAFENLDETEKRTFSELCRKLAA